MSSSPQPPKGGTPSAIPARVNPSGSTAAAPKECADCLAEPIRLYREFSGFDRHPASCPDPGVAGRAIGDARRDRRSADLPEHAAGNPQAGLPEPDLTQIRDGVHCAGYRLEFLVALVPDPLDSSSAELFDGEMRGLGEAMASSGYLPDRFWLPWGKAADQGQEHTYRNSPGVLLYRRGDASKRWLLSILVVGETPKQGIHKEAFHQALRLATALDDKRNGPMRVLGPSFSGSAESLRIALEDPLARGRQISFISGTATAAVLAEPGALGPPSSVSFCRTVPSDSKLTSTALDFLRDGIGWRCRRLALLSEGDTAFGKQNGISCGQRGLVNISFPSGLAEVRTAREESGAVTAQKPDSTGIQVPPSSLPLSLAEKGPSVDVLREQSPLTAPAEDLALANLFATIDHEDIRYLGILATDVRDQLFLATRIRRIAPDVILFTVDSDLLQAHPQYSADLDGLIVVTSAPLVTESRRWQRLLGGPGGSFVRQFRNKFEKGIYLAVRRLAPPDDPQPRSNERPGETGAWVSVVSNGALWPIFQQPVYRDVLDARADGACYAQAPPAPSDRRTAAPPRIADPRRPRAPSPGAARASLGESLQPDLALVVPLLVLLLGARWLGRTVARLGRSPVPLYPRRADRTCGPADASRLWTCGFAALLALGTVVIFLGALPIGADWRCIAYLALWGALFSILLWGAAQPAWPRLRRWTLAGALAAAAGALFTLTSAAVLCCLWIPSAAADGETQSHLFHFRARFLAGGLSPLVSLACLGAGFFVWTLAEVKRRTLVRRQRIDWPIPPAGDPALEPCRRLSGPIADILCRPPGMGGNGVRRGFWMAWAALIAISAWLLVRRIQPIAESRAYGIVFATLMLLLATLAAASFVQFFTLWRALDGLLDRLQHSRLLPVFRRVSDAVKWNPLRSFGRRVPKARLLLLSISKLPPADRSKLAPLLAEILGSEDLGPLEEEIAARRRVNQALEEAADAGAEAIGNPRIQDFFAIRVITYLRCVVVHLRSSLVGAFAPSLLLLAAVRTYAFAPQQAVSEVLWGSLLALAALTLWVFSQMDRDDVLSAIAGTEAGQITFDRHFFWNVFVYGVVPALTVVIGQFPQIGRFIAGWLNPLLRITSGG